MLKPLNAFLKLTRFEHSIMIAIAVLAAEVLSGSLPSAVPLAFSVVGPAFISAGAFAINDYFDVEVDRMNKKNRPIISGEISRNSALAVAVLSFALGTALSYAINYYCFAIAISFSAISILYSYKLKEVLLVGNLFVALSMAIPFIFGSFVAGNSISNAQLFYTAIILLAGLSREIDGTIRDYSGDIKARHANTLPRVIGKQASAEFALLLYVFATCIAMMLFFTVAPFKHNFAYLIPISAVCSTFLYIGAGHLTYSSDKFYAFSRKSSLVAMGIALLCIFLVAIA